jgi:hypothetical protein
MPRTTIATAGWTWSAVASGVIASLVLQVVLTMIGFAFGLVGVDAATTTALPVWLIFAWWALAGIFSAAAGGWVAGALSPTNDERLKGFGGLATWAIATLIVIGVSGVTVGAGGTALGALGGPVASATSTVQATQTSGQPSGRRQTVGQAAAAAVPSAEEARKQLAAAMGISAVALLLGAIAAFFGGRLSPNRGALES